MFFDTKELVLLLPAVLREQGWVRGLPATFG
jgi:hypothetical protein